MQDYSNVASYWFNTINKHGIIYDNLFMTYEDSNVIGFLPFKRVKSYSYSETLEDYVEVYTKSVEFIKILNSLKKKRQHIVRHAA